MQRRGSGISRASGDLLLALLLLAAAAGTARAVPSAYSVNFNHVPAAAPSSKDLSADCTCDLHPLVCDSDCCCDSDCAQAATDASRLAGACRPEGAAEQTLDFCVPDGFINRVNLPTSSDFFTLKKQAADDSFFGQLLCITQSSNPRLSDEYPDPPAGDVAGNTAFVPCPSVQASPPTSPATYQLQTPLAIRRGSSPNRALGLPAPVFSENCLDLTVGFLDNVPLLPEELFRSCVHAVPGAAALSALCASGAELDPTRYSGFTFASTPGAAATQALALQPVLVLDSSTGAVSESQTAAAAVASSFAGTVCSNAVQYINMTVFYSRGSTSGVEATISKVTMALTVTSVNASAGVFRQHVRTQFVASGAAVPAQTLQPFSGNPGYVTGLPLLAGVPITDTASGKQAVQRYTQGLPLPGGSETDGTCSPTAGTATAFGANTTANCAIKLTRAELQGFCGSGQPQRYLEAALGGVYAQLSAGNVRVGIWGNSNFTSVNEWLQVSVSNFPFNAMSFDATEGACSNVVVGYDLQVLTGVAFSANNLQQKVLFANLCFKTATWTFPATKAATDSHRFHLASSATFVPKAQERRTNIKKPAPPLRTHVPEYIFFPFVTSGAQPSAGGGGAGGLASAVALAAVAAMALLL